MQVLSENYLLYQRYGYTRSDKPIHSIPYSVAQPLERSFKNYYHFIMQGE